MSTFRPGIVSYSSHDELAMEMWARRHPALMKAYEASSRAWAEVQLIHELLVEQWEEANPRVGQDEGRLRDEVETEEEARIRDEEELRTNLKAAIAKYDIPPPKRKMEKPAP